MSSKHRAILRRYAKARNLVIVETNKEIFYLTTRGVLITKEEKKVIAEKKESK